MFVGVVGAAVIVLCVVAAVMSNPAPSALDVSATVDRAERAEAAPAEPQSVLPAVELKLAEKPRNQQARPTNRELRKLRNRVGRIATQTPPTSVRVGSFNILGSQHTRPGGTKGAGWPGSAARLPGAIERIQAHGVSVVGLQEAQPDQLVGLIDATGFAAYPGADADPLDRVNSILYDPRVFEFVAASTFQMSNGRGYRSQPIVLLRHIATNRQAYFVNAHPPSGHSPDRVAKRVESMQRLVSVVNDLRPKGFPIILTGDMNDRAAFVQRVISPAGLVSSTSTSGSMAVDWVVATPDVTFSDYVRDRSTVSRRISDHFFIAATATFGAAG